MSRGNDHEHPAKMPVSDGWEVESMHSDDESKHKSDVSIDNGNYRESVTGLSAKWWPGPSERKTPKKGGGLSDLGGHYISRKLLNMFRHHGGTPPGGRVTPKDDDPGPSPVRKAFSRKTDDLVLKTLSGHSDKVHPFESKNDHAEGENNRNISHYANPAYIPSFAEEHEHDVFSSGKRRSYEAPIYSVNSAGNPVPITIEESENEEDDYDVFGSAGRESRNPTQESSLPTASSLFTRGKGCCSGMLPESFPDAAKEKARSLWRHTYRPDSSVIFYWLCVVMITFLFNLWTIPLRATFLTEIQSSWQDIWFACDALCDFVYIVDIFITFRTCYIKSGVFVADLTHLNRHHRRDWRLVLDILSVLPTDLLFLHSINPYFRLNRLLKVHRVVTFYRLGELSTWSPNFWRTLNLVHIFAVIIHYNACFYYALSNANGFGTQLTSWAYPDPKFFPEYAALYRRYTYSFYWCMVGLGIVGDRYFPEADWQFVFSIYLHILGLLLMAVFIGFLTVLMFGKTVSKFQFEKTMHDTRHYMRQRKLPQDLRRRVLRFYQYSWANHQFSHLDENNMLRFLPVSVRQEIELHSNFAALKQIPSLARCDSNILRELVMRLSRTMYLPGQFVYRSGDLGSEMYIVGEGILQVIRDTDPAIYTLREGDVFGEIDLLNSTTKRRTADVVSYGYSELYVLTVKNVTETLEKYPKFMNLVHQQEKRRQTMANNKKVIKAYGGKYHAVSTGSIPSQSDSKASASKVHFRMSNGDIRRGPSLLDNRDESPDSGVPSTPSMGPMIHNETPTNPPYETIKSDLADKISGLYQDHLKSLKSSLDGIWYQEISYLQQRLDDTEQERDIKAREITHLRRQLAKSRDSCKNIPKKVDIHEANDLQQTIPGHDINCQTSVNDDVSSESDSPRKVIRSVKRKVSDNEHTMDQFGSDSTLGNNNNIRTDTQ